MKPLLILILSLSFSFAAFGQTIKNGDEVKIGKQVWMVKNLNVSTFRNGDTIPEAKSDKEWERAGVKHKPAWCYYNNDLSNGEKYGKLYNWYAVHDKRGLAPSGWHIPSKMEWDTLINYLGKKVAGIKMKDSVGWLNLDPNKNKGDNSCGFSATPSGNRGYAGDFGNIRVHCFFWSSTENKTVDGTAWAYYLYTYQSTLELDYTGVEAFGYSVRCIKDSL